MENQTVKTLALFSQSTAITEKAASIQVVDTLSQADAVAFVGQCRKAIKAVDERRKFFTDPINQQVKAINAMFAECLEPLKEADASVTVKVLTYQKQVKAQEESDKQAALAAAAIADVPVPKVDGQLVNVESGEIVERAATTIRTGGTSATFKGHWSYEIIDERLIPDTFKMVNTVAIGAAVRSGARIIPGVRIFEVEGMAITPAKEPKPNPFNRAAIEERTIVSDAKPVDLVKVKYFMGATELSTSAYTYYTAEVLKVGDTVMVDARGSMVKAVVSETGVSEETVSKFKDKVKVIPTGSKVTVIRAGQSGEVS